MILMPAIQAMTGMYLNISLFTPLREANGDEPVKLSVMNPLTAGMASINGIDCSNRIHMLLVELKNTETTKGRDKRNPTIMPFVLKSCVGSHGKKTKKSIPAPRTVAAAAPTLIQPPRK